MKVLKDRRYKNKDFPIPFSLFAPNQSAEMCFENEVVDKNFEQFNYNINSKGFRFDETDKPKKICFVGCSHTFGHGLAQHQTFPELLTKKLGNDWQCINVGMPGSGPDIQSVNLNWAIENYDIDTVVWYMSIPTRQVIKKGLINVFVPPYVDFLETAKDQKKFLKTTIELEDTNFLKTYWNLYTTFSLLKSKRIKTYFRCWDGKFHSDVKDKLLPLFDIKDFINLKELDLARDNAHKGPKSHEWFAQQIFEVMDET